MINYFVIENSSTVYADKRMHNDTVKKLWKSFCLNNGEINFENGENFTFRLGDVSIPKLSSDKEYVLTVTENGVAIVGKDYGGLMRGFMSLLMKIEWDDEVLKIGTVTEESDYNIKNRMIHICIFPENDFYFIKKLIRLAGLCQYTHIIIEFWGMLKYDCLKELAWPNAFTKEQAKELIDECRELGIEPIPMFNQLGHATASRVCYGKHVVLDQNPQLQHYFTPDGWAWNITSPKVFDLFKKIRTELYDLFGECEYMHVGFDEAYFITRNENLRKQLPDFLAKVTSEVEAEGRRPMIWMDMLLEEKTFENCTATGKKDEISKLRNSAAKSTVFVDWQYRCTETPIPTSVSLKDCGHDVMGAPWYNPDNYTAHIQTITENNFFGVMMTTWHTLNERMPSVLGCAKKCGARSFVWSQFSGLREETATLLRRVSFEGNTYADSGWSKEQIEV